MTLRSRVIRAAVAEARVRIVDINPLTSDEQEWSRSGWMGLASKLLAKAWKVIWRTVTRLSFTDLLGKIFAPLGFLYNFNFNISETEIKAQINAAWVRIAGLTGSGLGKTIGTISAGALGYGACLVIFPGPVAALLGRKIASELLLQLAGELGLIIKLIFVAAFQAASLWLYGKVKQAIKGSDKSFIAKLKKKGFDSGQIAKAMAERDKPWSLRGKVEEFKEFLGGNNDAQKAFAENLIEDAQESFIEAGYTVAGIMDEYVASQQNPNLLEIDFQQDGTVKVKNVS
jgi:hypothetical protein